VWTIIVQSVNWSELANYRIEVEAHFKVGRLLTGVGEPVSLDLQSMLGSRI
jgi:hypothetical protein